MTIVWPPPDASETVVEVPLLSTTGSDSDGGRADATRDDARSTSPPEGVGGGTYVLIGIFTTIVAVALVAYAYAVTRGSRQTPR